jgi:hypothetical protein
MKKTLVILFILIPVSGLICLSAAYSQEDMKVIDNSVFGKPARPAATFVHDEHNEKAGIDECAVCHHLYIDGKLVEGEDSIGQSCSDCHLIHATGNNLPLMKAFHKRCKGCHQQKNAGPIMCGECHQK